MLFYLCIKIFFVRIIDVSLGTVRTVFSVKGKNLIASLIGLVEVTVWFLIVKEALNTDESSLWVGLSYAAGFATGTYIGGYISQKFIQSNFCIQVITTSYDMVDILRNSGYGVSVIDIKGKKEEKKYMLYISITNKSIGELKKLILSLDKKAFIVIDEIQTLQNGFIKK
ncbi:MAG: DUF5698 domain-containing protein [Clostridium sp.]|nr:DUF5698 domain-containing protein [Clostridium sp.]MCM1444202.1 DUF5698 domain-containing protein [Candidatus Amulumruptor caecigallinarius]